jgi:hypothetical protein
MTWTFAIVILITPFLSFLLWGFVKVINRQVQRLIPDGALKRKLNTRLYQALGEPKD